MKICVYHSSDAPASHAYVARLLVAGGFLPIIFNATTEDGVRARAQTWWDKQSRKEASRKLGTAGAAQELLGKLGPVVEPPVAEDDALAGLLG